MPVRKEPSGPFLLGRLGEAALPLTEGLQGQTSLGDRPFGGYGYRSVIIRTLTSLTLPTPALYFSRNMKRVPLATCDQLRFHNVWRKEC